MRLTFLGTGTSQGVPVIACECEVCRSLDYRDQRLRTSVYIETENGKYVVDSGPDFRTQILRANIKELDALLFTHEHKDHVAGLDDIRAFNYRTKKDFPIYLEQRVFNQIKQEFYYAFAENKYPGVPSIVPHIINHTDDFIIKNDVFTPISVLHYKLPVLGFKIKKLAYVTDANFISEEEKEKLKGLDVLILNALHKKEHISHYNLQQALEIVSELKPKKAYFTHISHQMGLHKNVQNELPENVFLAYDGLVLDF